MRNVLAVAAVLAATVHATAWETTVRDRLGLRTVELRGASDRGEAFGVALICYPDSGEAALIYGTPATKDYSLRLGADVTLAIGSLSLAGELVSNDSTDTTAVVEGLKLDGVIAEIAGGGKLELTIAELRNAESIVPREGWDEALSEFSQACGL